MYRVSNVSTLTAQKIVLIICALSEVEFIFGSDTETDLINKLLRKYQRYSRPVADPGSTLDLNITLTLKQIIDLDEKNQLLKTNLWLEYYWFDDKVQWKPEQYGGIKDIRIPSKNYGIQTFCCTIQPQNLVRAIQSISL